MSVYTKKGDCGESGVLGSTRRLVKSDLVFHVLGTGDELNSIVGLAREQLVSRAPSGDAHPLIDQLIVIQTELLELGSLVALTAGKADEEEAPVETPDCMVGSAQRLEREVDAMQAQLPVLKNFLLPGGCEVAGQLHVARTVARRYERLLKEFGSAPPPVMQWANRLSDYLFVAARYSTLLFHGIERVYKDHSVVELKL